MEACPSQELNLGPHARIYTQVVRVGALAKKQ